MRLLGSFASIFALSFFRLNAAQHNWGHLDLTGETFVNLDCLKNGRLAAEAAYSHANCSDKQPYELKISFDGPGANFFISNPEALLVDPYRQA